MLTACKDNLKRARSFVWINVLTFAALLLVRLLELVMVAPAREDMPIGRMFTLVLFNDTIYFFFLIACLIPLYWLIHRIHPGAAKTLHVVFVASVLFLALATSLYYAATLAPLGKDLYAYSMRDLGISFIFSGGLKFKNVLLLLAAALGIAGIFRLGRQLPASIFLGVSFFGLTLLCAPVYFFLPLDRTVAYNSQTQRELVSNKSNHLIASSVAYLLEKKSPQSTQLKGYPWLRPFEPHDVLRPHFQPGDAPPNLVFIIVEGLGSALMEGGEWAGFLPHLDSLSRNSLYWDNFLSTSGRTFGVLPSLFGSLPYGEKGFMEIKSSQIPHHLTLFSLLKKNGYYTSFYYSSKVQFDNQDVFLNYQQVDRIIDQSCFPPPYQKAEVDSEGFTWGYTDKDLYKRSLEVISEHNRLPRLDVYLTMSTHEPFVPPEKELSRRRFDDILARMPREAQHKFRQYRDIFATFLYADDALGEFIARYRDRPEYRNTIFIITGDHRLIPLPMKTMMDRFRVPLIIHSPMLRQPRRFDAVSSHADVPLTLASFLAVNYRLKFPSHTHWLGQGIDVTEEFRNIHSIPLMRNKNELLDYLDGGFFYSDGRLYEVQDRLEMKEIENQTKRQELLDKLARFKEINDYVCGQNKLFPPAR